MKKIILKKMSLLVGIGVLVMGYQNCGELGSQSFEEDSDFSSQNTEDSSSGENFGVAPLPTSNKTANGSFSMKMGENTVFIKPGTTLFKNKIYYDGNLWRYSRSDKVYPFNEQDSEEVLIKNSVIKRGTSSSSTIAASSDKETEPVSTSAKPNYGVPPQGLSLGGTSINLTSASPGYDGRKLIRVGDKALSRRVYWAPGWRYVSNKERYPLEYHRSSKVLSTGGVKPAVSTSGTSAGGGQAAVIKTNGPCYGAAPNGTSFGPGGGPLYAYINGKSVTFKENDTYFSGKIYYQPFGGWRYSSNDKAYIGCK